MTTHPRLVASRLFGWLSVAAGCATPGFAQSPTPTSEDDLSSLPLEQLLEIRAETVDAASRRQQLVSEAPSAVTVIDRDEIRKLGRPTLADILRQVRGFYVSYDRNYSYLGVRGFSRPGDYNTRILFLVNGQRLNDAVTEATLIGTEFPVDVDLIERVEVVRGPGSAIYGSSALFGVVNVVTRPGSAYDHGQISAEIGSFDAYKGRITAGHQWKNEVELLLSGTWFDRGGQAQLGFPEFVDPPNSDGVARHLDRESYQNATARLQWRGLSLETGWVDRHKRIPTGAFDTLFGAAGTETDDSTYYIRGRWEHSFESEWQVIANLSYNRSQYDGAYVYGQDLPGEPDRFTLLDGYRSQWLGQDVLVRREFWEQLTVTTGVEFRENLQQDQFSAEQRAPFTRQLDDQRRSLQAGPYAEVAWQALPQLSLSAGARYDYYEGRANAWNPRLAAVYQPWDATHLKLLYGTAFRAPNAYEMYYSDGFQTQKPSPDLQPERIRTYEAVWEQDYGKHWKTTLAGFLYEATELITQGEDPADGLLFYRNIRGARAVGLEGEVEGRWESGLRGRLSYTFQQAEDDESRQRLSNSPRHLAQGSLIIPLYQEHLHAGINGRYLSSRTTDIGGGVAGHFVMDVTLFALRWAKGAELSATVYNLLDREYADPVGTELRPDSVRQDGRTFRLKFTYSF
jgi:outer membrane receptor for ferrienterochelin and colicins